MKKRNVIIIFILVLLLIIGFCFVMFFNNRNKENKEKSSFIIEETENLSALGSSLSDKIVLYGVNQLDMYEKDANFSSNVSNEQLLTMLYYFTNTQGKDTFSKNEVNDYFKAVYNISLASYPDIRCPNDGDILAKYEDEKYVSLFQNHDHSIGFNPPITVVVNDIRKEKNNYILNLSKVYLSISEKSGFFSDPKDQNKISGLNSFVSADGETKDSEAITYYTENYKNFSSLKPVYEYTFKKDGDNYYLIKYRVIK